MHQSRRPSHRSILQLALGHLLFAVILVWGVGGAFAEVPTDRRGVHGYPAGNQTCDPSRPFMVLNGSMVAYVTPSGNEHQLLLGSADYLNGAVLLKRRNEFFLLPPLDSLVPCQRVPGLLGSMFAEAIAVFGQLDDLSTRCATGAPGGCVESFMDLLDVSGDRSLSKAEISRGIRVAASYFAYESVVGHQLSSKSNLGFPYSDTVSADNIYAATVALGIAAPYVTSNLLDSYDYDDDGRLSAAELLQDRSDMNLEEMWLAIGLRFGEQGAQGLIRSLPSALQGLTKGLLGGL